MFLLAVNQAQNSDNLINDMQGKFTEIQQHEIEFLNNFITHLGWIFGVAASIVSLIVVYIAYANRQAEKKMKEAEKVLGAAQAAKDELERYKAELEENRKQSNKEFEELKALVNSEEISKIKESMGFLYKEKEVKHIVDEIQKLLKTGEELLNTLKENNIPVNFSTTAQFKICKERIQYYSIKSRQLMYDPSDVDYLLESCTSFQRKCINVVTTLQKILRDGTREFEESLSREEDNDIN